MSAARGQKTAAEVDAFLRGVSPDAPANGHPGVAASEPPAYIEPLAAFLAEADPPEHWVFPDLLPRDVIMLIHGEPRARKSLVAFELALSAGTGTAPFGLARFQPTAPLGVLYIQEEDPRALTKKRLRRLVAERCGDAIPEALHVSVRRGVNLDDDVWGKRLIADCLRLNITLLVLDAARRLSTKTDEGPTKVRELVAVLRTIVTEAGVTIIIVHHDVKPPVIGEDGRRRGQRASGGDWFAASECPVHVERLTEAESVVFPQDYKFAPDPAPFNFTCALDGRLIKALVGVNTTTETAELAGKAGRLLAWIKLHPYTNITGMKKAGFGFDTVKPLVAVLEAGHYIDSVPGKKADSHHYFATGAGLAPAAPEAEGHAS